MANAKLCIDNAKETKEKDFMVDEDVEMMEDRASKSKLMKINGPNPITNGNEANKGFNMSGHHQVCSAKVDGHCKKMMKEVLHKVRMHKHGPLFESRLHNQKSVEYMKMIRRPMDLETIQSKLDQDEYGTSFQKFFIDLLLLVNNAIVFFEKTSEEHIAALQLRDLVKAEMNKIIPNPFLGREPVYVQDVPRGVTVVALCAPPRKN